MVKAALRPDTILVSLMMVNNEIGTITDVAAIGELTRANKTFLHVDAAQAAGKVEIDLSTMKIDLMSFSGHKIYAPTGIGALYGKEKWLSAIPPYQGGGEMIATVTFEKTTYNELPFKFEAGTPDYIGSTALAEALKYVSNIGIDNIAAYEHELLMYATEKLREIEGMRIIGNAQNKSSVISFLVNDIHPYDIGMLLDKLGIAVRTGHHCAQPLIDSLGIPGTVRASFAFYNTKKEIDIFVAALKKVVAMLS